MKKMNWLDNLKLRVSWGQLGNNSIGNYEWQAVYATAPHYAFGNKEVPGLGMGSFPTITWNGRQLRLPTWVSTSLC